jgi:hypothetical protein
MLGHMRLVGEKAASSHVRSRLRTPMDSSLPALVQSVLLTSIRSLASDVELTIRASRRIARTCAIHGKKYAENQKPESPSPIRECNLGQKHDGQKVRLIDFKSRISTILGSGQKELFSQQVKQRTDEEYTPAR